MISFFIGPSTGKVTGQSIAFNIIYDNYSGKKYLINYPDPDEGFLSLFKGYIKSFFVFIFINLLFFFKKKTVYITSSRTLIGFFRDAIYIIVGKLFFAKVVNHLHGADFKYFRNEQCYIIKKIIDYVYNKIDVSIVLTARMKEQYNIYRKMKIKVIGNCYFGLSYRQEKKIFNNETLKLVFLSNLLYSKGIVHLINVVKRINNEGIKVSLEIAGKILSDEYVDSCKLKEILEAKIENCPYIKYHGPLNSEKKSALLNRSDVFVLPTFYRSEAQPISVLEAMYFGCVIVTTAHNYMPDFVTAKNGIIINPDDEDDLYKALLKINNMKSIFSDVAAYNACYVKKNFSPENYINKITSVIIED